MAGTAADRELSRRSGTRFTVATPADDPAIRRLLRDNPMPGAIRLTSEREPDYFRGAGVADAEDETIVARQDGRLVCMGRISRRDCWVNGRIAPVGYLAELRLDAAVRGQFTVLRGGYRFFHERQRAGPAKLYFTSIAADNERARSFLERGARGMPTYGFLSELITLLIAVPPRPSAARLRLRTATPDRVPEMLRVLNGQAQRHQLAAVWTAESLQTLARHGLPLSGFLLALEGGSVVACGALWDQRNFRQTVIQGYAPALAAARPVLNAAARFLGTPRLPRPGAALAHAFLSPLAFAQGSEGLLPEFVEACFPSAQKLGVEFLTLALPATDAGLRPMQRRFVTRVYRSRLYRVDWPGEPPFELAPRTAGFLPDVSLL